MHSSNSVFALPLILWLSACASAPPDSAGAQQSPRDANYRQYADDFVDDFARTKLSQNGPSLFCDQPGYLSCYNISHERCLQELSRVKDDCFKKTEQKFPNKLKGEKDIDQFAGYYAVCMSFQHVTMHTEKEPKQLGACLKSVNWDKAQRDKSLLK